MSPSVARAVRPVVAESTPRMNKLIVRRVWVFPARGVASPCRPEVLETLSDAVASVPARCSNAFKPAGWPGSVTFRVDGPAATVRPPPCIHPHTAISSLIRLHLRRLPYDLPRRVRALLALWKSSFGKAYDQTAFAPTFNSNSRLRRRQRRSTDRHRPGSAGGAEVAVRASVSAFAHGVRGRSTSLRCTQRQHNGRRVAYGSCRRPGAMAPRPLACPFARARRPSGAAARLGQRRPPSLPSAGVLRLGHL